MKIKDIAKKFDLPPDTLRYWERVGAIPPVGRDSAGYRDYDQEDEDWIYYTKCMKDLGMSIERIIEYINLFKQGEHTVQSRKEVLIEQREEVSQKLADLQEMFNMLDHKIKNYESLMLSYEGKLRDHEQKNS